MADGDKLKLKSSQGEIFEVEPEAESIGQNKSLRASYVDVFHPSAYRWPRCQP